MVFIKKKQMNKLFKLLILLLVIEVSLGYLFYLRDSTTFLVTGHYYSSTIRALVKVKRIFETTTKDLNIKRKQIICKDIMSDNTTFEVGGIISYRKPMELQTNVNFLNTINLEKDYLIFIVGDSEAGGVYQKGKDKLHVNLQKKLRNEFQSENIFVVNLGYNGGMIAAHLTDLLNFSKIYNPDLVLFYTGGNELSILNIYENFVINHNFHIKKHKWFSLKEKNSSHWKQCLKKELFITEENFHNNHFILDLEKYIKNNFEDIDKTLTDKSIDFIFYIHPFSNKIKPSSERFKMFNTLINFDHPDEQFINLNLSNEIFEPIYTDIFHTTDLNTIPHILFNDILKNYEKKIITKINKQKN